MVKPSKYLPADAQERISIHELQELYRTVRTLIRAAVGIAFAWFGFDALKGFAGHETNLTVMLSVFAELKVIVLVGLSGSCAIWAIVERGLRHRKVEQLQWRIKELETKIDPSRTSSGLTPKGKTNPRDRIK